LYGTFLYNCESERLVNDAKNKTVSIWTDVINDIHKFKNHFYEKQNIILNPNYSIHKLRFWEEFFLKYNTTCISPKIYIDFEKNIYVKSSMNYFICNKIQDNLNLENMQNELKELYEVLRDVNNKTSNKEIYHEFTVRTKFYLNNCDNMEDNQNLNTNEN
jgi:hypothetical protein